MNADPEESKEWFLLGGAAVGAMVAMVAGPHLLVVVAAGAIIGIIFAPKPGRETRKEIGVWARHLYSRAEDIVSPTTNWSCVEITPQPSDQPQSRDLIKIPN